MKLNMASALAAAILAALFVGFYLYRDHGPGGPRGLLDDSELLRMASPGALSAGHAFLEHQCSACHTPVVGVETSACVVCHANNAELLGRQPTSFHADVDTCVPCHLEHDGPGVLTRPMDHAALVEIGIEQLSSAPGPDDEGALLAARVRRWLVDMDVSSESAGAGSAWQVLECTTCHGNDDRHFGLFGSSCSDCHTDQTWSLPRFRHPSQTSRDCSQCHQAPPSHYMGHFRMISQRVADRGDARVDQCYQCHQTTTWIDIQRVGTYQHH